MLMVQIIADARPGPPPDSGTGRRVIYRAAVTTPDLRRPTGPGRRRRARAVGTVLAAALAGALAGCGGGPATAPSTSATGTPTGTTTGTPTAPPTTASASPTPSVDPTTACVQDTLAGMSEAQRIGQLLMVGFDTAAPLGSLDDLVEKQHVGNVIYLGGWDGADKVRRTSRHLQGLVSDASTSDVGLLVAADQEGGEVHQLRGQGFTWPPSALEQAQMSPAALTKAARGWAEELRAVGVNVNLAPVTDTVPADLGRANQPIGRWGREYGSTPEAVTRSATAFLRGMLAGGVEPTVKHFPGIGRIRNNTDFDATGITDDVTDADDPYLEPFQAGIDAGAGLVMVGSARYTKLDKGVPAMFSAPVVTDLLRERMGYDGVVVTDDVNAVAVRATPAPQRAVEVVRAGGDIVLTGDASLAPSMAKALAAEAKADETFADRLDASAERVLRLKHRMGLLPCSPQP
jgi:beta-N-acetylhexosaminidase